MAEVINFFQKKNEIKMTEIKKGWKEFPIYNPNNDFILVKKISDHSYSLMEKNREYDYNDYLWISLKEIEDMIDYLSENSLA